MRAKDARRRTINIIFKPKRKIDDLSFINDFILSLVLIAHTLCNLYGCFVFATVAVAVVVMLFRCLRYCYCLSVQMNPVKAKGFPIREILDVHETFCRLKFSNVHVNKSH